MITDQREETLREVCALGNIKAAQHFANSGVNLNSQNKMNGWYGSFEYLYCKLLRYVFSFTFHGSKGVHFIGHPTVVTSM